MAADGLDVLAEELGSPGALGAGRGGGDGRGLEVGGERHLRIDGDVLAAGQVDHHVWPARPGVAADAGLHVEVDALEETGGLDDVAELRLAPDAAGAVRLERGRKRLGGGAEALLGLGGGPELFAELAVLSLPLLLEFGHLGLNRAQALGHGAQGCQYPPVGGAATGLRLGGRDQAVVELADALLLLIELTRVQRLLR
ncbi:hypothetical protein GCM10025867_19100 [Frondihabitans sucicola]|uniref:Uncharacterized protein n=1 Tax=Frondihabitans sucicola TaxID=1268041 RepID=A0ABN6XXG3_9MICO|nr:hypothetical protein GCM10025867_19100 [Frondihabitans sucicola]